MPFKSCKTFFTTFAGIGAVALATFWWQKKRRTSNTKVGNLKQLTFQETLQAETLQRTEKEDLSSEWKNNELSSDCYTTNENHTVAGPTITHVDPQPEVLDEGAVRDREVRAEPEIENALSEPALTKAPEATTSNSETVETHQCISPSEKKKLKQRRRNKKFREKKRDYWQKVKAFCKEHDCESAQDKQTATTAETFSFGKMNVQNLSPKEIKDLKKKRRREHLQRLRERYNALNKTTKGD